MTGLAMRSSQSPSRARSAMVSAVRAGTAARRVTAAAALLIAVIIGYHAHKLVRKVIAAIRA